MIFLVTCHDDAMIQVKRGHCLGQTIHFAFEILIVEFMTHLNEHFGPIIRTCNDKVTFTTLSVIINMVAGILMPQ